MYSKSNIYYSTVLTAATPLASRTPVVMGEFVGSLQEYLMDQHGVLVVLARSIMPRLQQKSADEENCFTQ